MKLDRNINKDSKGKYALIKLRGLNQTSFSPFQVTPDGQEYFMIPVEAVDFGNDGDDFFVIRLKDKYAAPALVSYARACALDDQEYSEEIAELARIAACHPLKKMPD